MGKKRKQKKSGQGKPPSAESSPAHVTSGVRKKEKQPVPKRREGPNWPLTILAGAGMALTAYLVLTIWMGQQPLYCSEGSTCDIVQRSRWGTFLKLPTAFWGFLTYASLAFIGFRVRTPEAQWKSAWTVSFLGLGYSLYLNAISLFVIEAMCAYCIASLSIMALIFIVVSFRPPAEPRVFYVKSLAIQTTVVAMVMIAGMHLHYSGLFDPAAGPENPYLKGLAEHLIREKALFYGAFW